MKTIISMLSLVHLIFMTSVLYADPISFAPHCTIEYEKYCITVKQPKAKIVQCLLQHEDGLSENCKSDVKTYSQKIQNQAGEACKDDRNKHCKWTIPGGGRIIKCLFKYENDLTEACKKVLSY